MWWRQFQAPLSTSFREVMVASPEEAEHRAQADHAALVGRHLLVPSVMAYEGQAENLEEYHFSPPLRVRLMPTNRDSLLHWSDDQHLDPYWDVEVRDPRGRHLRSAWLEGLTYKIPKRRR